MCCGVHLARGPTTSPKKQMLQKMQLSGMTQQQNPNAAVTKATKGNVWKKELKPGNINITTENL